MSNLIESYITAWTNNHSKGIPSVCSSHPAVLEVSLKSGYPLLIESTCNQVNQFGGYTGMKPGDFAKYVHNLATELGISTDLFELGGDHLGPSPWQNDTENVAMDNAKNLIKFYIEAGYKKIHLDASMPLADDIKPLKTSLVAKRTAELAQVAEEYKKKPVYYVIGSEVPTPGGLKTHEESIKVTTVSDVQETLLETKKAFYSHGLQDAWQRVIAIVVQPGVEFGNNFIEYYSIPKTRQLKEFIGQVPFVFEAHSTDFQTPNHLKQMAQDGFEILKVGPALTFAYREAIFILSWIEKEIFPESQCSGIVKTIERIMQKNPNYWEKHYRGSKKNIEFSRKFSYSDRIRYYWNFPEVKEALNVLNQNLNSIEIPLSLLSQYDQNHYEKIITGESENTFHSLIFNRISKVLSDYHTSCCIE